MRTLSPPGVSTNMNIFSWFLRSVLDNGVYYLWKVYTKGENFRVNFKGYPKGDP